VPSIGHVKLVAMVMSSIAHPAHDAPVELFRFIDRTTQSMGHDTVVRKPSYDTQCALLYMIRLEHAQPSPLNLLLKPSPLANKKKHCFFIPNFIFFV
jgi:hypothetical protein